MKAISEHKIKIAQVVREILLQNTEIVNFIEDKIVPVVASEGTEGDFITYKRFGYSQEFLTKTGFGASSEKCQLMIEIVSSDYDRALDIGYIISNYLVRDWLYPNMRISIEDSDEDYKDKKFYQIFLFNIE